MKIDIYKYGASKWSGWIECDRIIFQVEYLYLKKNKEIIYTINRKDIYEIDIKE